MLNGIHKLVSPKHFYAISGRLIPWLGVATVITLIAGVYAGLVIAPADARQGEAYRIIFIHVPSAWMSMFIYVVMAGAGAIGLIWRIKLAQMVARASAPIGASLTFLTLVTGSLWGKPMWGAWWVWDGRLTSELILLFLYIGYMALESAIDDKQKAANAGAVLILAGVINIPIIHFSVEWWNTLHQGPTVTKLDTPSIDLRMLAPLLIMALAFKLYYVTTVLMRLRCEILDRERHTGWVRNVVLGEER